MLMLIVFITYLVLLFYYLPLDFILNKSFYVQKFIESFVFIISYIELDLR